MDIALGVSMAPTAIRMVLVEGENADGVTIEEDSFDVCAADDPATVRPSDQVVSAILGTREGAVEGGYRLASTGVTWTDPVDAAALHDVLAGRKIENVMLVSAFLAAAALTQNVGQAMGYARTAMLVVEPDTATLAIVDSADGSITDVVRRPLPDADVTAELAAMLAGLDALDTRPAGLFAVGCGVDIAPIKPALEATTWLPVSLPEEPETALARGAALAAANAPLFSSSTDALAYAQDPGTGQVDLYALGYLGVPGVWAGGEPGEDDLAYSAVPDDADAATTEAGPAADGSDARQLRSRPGLLVGSALAVVAVTAALALEIALGWGIRPTVALQPDPGQHLVVPAQAAPPAPARVPVPQSRTVVPTPAIHPARAVPPVSVPVAALPVPAAPPVPVPLPAAPVRIPLPVTAPAAPVPLPIPLPIPMGLPGARVQAPVHLPTPPVHLPTPPMHLPTPPMHLPTPPVRAPAP
ncbi:hypothetical protein, partial [Mycobacterium sp.]|uniref:DUF7159 family protein n=1 Tax=Mycobacterium sp. TaxID=1785 RepID=UPI0031D4BE3E